MSRELMKSCQMQLKISWKFDQISVGSFSLITEHGVFFFGREQWKEDLTRVKAEHGQ